MVGKEFDKIGLEDFDDARCASYRHHQEGRETVCGPVSRIGRCQPGSDDREGAEESEGSGRALYRGDGSSCRTGRRTVVVPEHEEIDRGTLV